MNFKYLFTLLLLLLTTSCAKYSYNNTCDAQATFDNQTRLLLLDGDKGSVACRIYGNLMSGTIPRRSKDGSLESATRSLLRMKNLTAFRGVAGASMIGPIDYLGNLEEPDKYLYTIKSGFPPVFYRWKMTTPVDSNLKDLDKHVIITIRANWISGKDFDTILEKKNEYMINDQSVRHSLFKHPGLLEIDRGVIEFKYFDPRGIDLSSFKARLVNNNIPFQITKAKLSSKDDYRLVTYLYEPLYANWQVENGSGLFLEKHRFSQIITPITTESKGFVVLARTNDHHNELELIALQIPYGYSLIIEKDCIHGDSTLDGYFMMGMTSDHITMGTADTVFLKYVETKENVAMVLIGLKEKGDGSKSTKEIVPPPFVIYKNPTEDERAKLKELTNGKNFIFNPFSKEYWER